MPNETVRECYQELNQLLEQGDKIFAKEGPSALKRYTQKEGFFDDVDTVHAEKGEYTRTLIMGGGEPDDMAMIFMEWPEDHHLVPHEHNGRPCFEELIEGRLEVTEMSAEQLEEDKYQLIPEDNHTVNPRETATIYPPEGEIHSVDTEERSRSIHVYPDSFGHGYAYRPIEDSTKYTRELFELSVDERLHL